MQHLTQCDTIQLRGDSMLKNRERIGTTLPTELAKELKEYSKESMVPVSKIIEKAVEEYLQKRATRK